MTFFKKHALFKKYALAFHIVAALLLFVALNYAAALLLTSARTDLTEENLYTLADGTHSTIANLQEPVSLTLFYSKSLTEVAPTLNPFVKQVESLLKEYTRLGHGNIRLRIINPEPFSEEEDEALRYGLQGVPSQDGATLYFGLVGTNSIDTVETIPFFAPSREGLLEYDLTRLLHKLAYPQRTKVGFYSGLPVDGDVWRSLQAGAGVPEPWAIMTQLRSFFAVTSLSQLSSELTSDIDVLVLAYPSQLTPSDLYAVDQYILHGGRALILLDPLSEATVQRTPPSGFPDQTPPVTAVYLQDLLQPWGLEMTPSRLVADRQLAQRINIGQADPLQIVDYPAWLAVPRSQMQATDAVTADLQLLNLASVGDLQIRDDKPADVTITPLITSTADSQLLATQEVESYPDYAGLIRSFQPDDQTHTLAVRLSGTLPTAFPNGPPPGAKTDVPALTQSQEAANIIIVADSDFLEDHFWVQAGDMYGQRVFMPLADNGHFIINAIENLSGHPDLISLRSRHSARRPFQIFEQMQKAAETTYLQEEQRLRGRLRTIEREIQNLRQGSTNEDGLAATNSTELLTPEQQTLLRDYNTEILSTRQQLRAVQHALRRDIIRLQAWLEFINIGLMPLFIAAGAIAFGIWRHRRLRRARRRSMGQD